jgi:hypothetical protein
MKTAAAYNLLLVSDLDEYPLWQKIMEEGYDKTGFPLPKIRQWIISGPSSPCGTILAPFSYG